MGSVHLVGAGPGAPDLLTRRGLERLRAADVVLFDRLVSPELLDEAPARALRIDVGKASAAQCHAAHAANDALPQHPRRSPITQEHISRLLVEYALGGLIVVRLKGGDPFVFGRGAEELDACRAAGVPCEVVPGLSSALAAPALGGISLTERGVARSFSVSTARTGLGEPTLAQHGGGDTRVILMGVAQLPSIIDELLADGLASSTPAALVASASWPHQRVLRSTLASVAADARAARIEPPAVLVVGAVAGRALANRSGPLCGFTIALTRPDDASRRTRALLATTGARVVGSPLIDVVYRDDGRDSNGARDSSDNLDEDLRGTDWIAFTSRHGVEGLWQVLARRGLDARALAGKRLAVVGPGTASALERRGLRADRVAQPHRVDALVAALREERPDRVLFAGGSRGRRELLDGLARAGVAVHERVVYDTVFRPPSRSFRLELEHGVDAVVFASPSAARSYALHRLPVKAGANDRGPVAICLGPSTAEEARHLGFPALAVAVRHDDRGLVDRIVEQLNPFASLNPKTHEEILAS